MNILCRLSIVAAAFALIAPCATAADFVFSITEGVTYYQTNREIQARFQPLSDLLAKALKRPVRMVVVSPYNDLREGLAKQEYDLSFIHPAHVSLAAIKSGQYHSVAWTTGFTDYSVFLLINKDQPYTKFDDLKGHTVVSPDPDSITAAMLRAMLRDQKFGSTDIKIITTRYQDAVPFYVEYGFAQAGATAAKSVAKSWTSKGGKILLTSRPTPIKQFIASSRLSADDDEKVRTVLTTLGQSDGGKHALTTLGYQGFVPPNREDELKAIAWLGL
jgi:ABC-type phosphate/phosphonate transport system substrate-binding protein